MLLSRLLIPRGEKSGQLRNRAAHRAELKDRSQKLLQLDVLGAGTVHGAFDRVHRGR